MGRTGAKRDAESAKPVLLVPPPDSGPAEARRGQGAAAASSAGVYWLAHVFRAKAVAKGGVVRRSVAWVEREVGRQRLIDEVKSRGYHLIESGVQFIVICNHGQVKLVS
jgi:hypothetical protein